MIPAQDDHLLAALNEFMARYMKRRGINGTDVLWKSVEEWLSLVSEEAPIATAEWLRALADIADPRTSEADRDLAGDRRVAAIKAIQATYYKAWRKP